MPAINRRAASDSAAKIGAKVQARRVRQGMSRDKLGHAVGVSGQQIARYESGANRISSPVLEKMADALDCEPGDFLNHKRKPEGE